MPPFPKPLDCFVNCYDPISARDLRDVERDIGFTLPDDYKQFLLKQNGGYSNKWRSIMYPVRRPTQWITYVTVDSFSAVIVESHEDADDLRQNIGKRLGCDPNRLSIAHGSQLTYMTLDGPDYGKVYAFDDAHFEGDPDYYLAADSFSEWLESLVFNAVWKVPYEIEEQQQIFRAVELGSLYEVAALVEQEDSVDTVNERGETLLMAAARFRWPKVLSFLCDRGADIEATDELGKTPLCMQSSTIR